MMSTVNTQHGRQEIKGSLSGILMLQNGLLFTTKKLTNHVIIATPTSHEMAYMHSYTCITSMHANIYNQ